MVVQPAGGPGTVVAELLVAKARLVSVAASNAVAAAATPRTARLGRLWRGGRIRKVGRIRFSLLLGGRWGARLGRYVRP